MARYQFCLTAEVEENIFHAMFWFIITSRIKHDFPKLNTTTNNNHEWLGVGDRGNWESTYSLGQNVWDTFVSLLLLPSQCWCARFGGATAINNIGRMSRWARSKKAALGGSVPTIFFLVL